MKIDKKIWNFLNGIIISNARKVGRREAYNKEAFEGMLYVLKNGVPWHSLPQKFGSPTTVHGKFMRWSRRGLFDKLLKEMRAYYRGRYPKNSWYAIDTSFHKASFSRFAGRNPTDRGRQGIKSIVIVDHKGAPLFVDIAAANIHDSQLLDPILSSFRTSQKARILAGDAAFDSRRLRRICAQKNIALLTPSNPRRNSSNSDYRPYRRWVIERTFGWLSWLRGIKPCRSKTYISCLSLFQIAVTTIIGRLI